MRGRGVGFGAAFAIIVIAVVLLMGTYYLLSTYTSAKAALEDVAAALQKPRIEIGNVRVLSNGTLIVYLYNLGPGGAKVERVAVYREDVNGIPTDTIVKDVETYLPVGGTLPVAFPNAPLEDIVFWGKPVRVLVETEKGFEVLSYPTLTGDIYVNVKLPTWYGELSSPLTLELDVEQPSGYTTQITLTPDLPTCNNPTYPVVDRWFSYRLCYDPNTQTYTVKAHVIAGVELRFTAKVISGTIPAMVGKENEISLFPTTQASRRFALELYGVSHPVTIGSSLAVVNPGSSQTISFTVPDLIYKNYQISIKRPEGFASYVVDFSHLFEYHYPSTKLGVNYETAKLVGGSPDQSSTYNADYEEVGRRILTIAGRLIHAGALEVSSSCKTVYPVSVAMNGEHPTVPETVAELAWAAVSRFIPGESSKDNGVVTDTGLPIIVDAGSCTGSTGSVTATLKLPLQGGKYIVIPVFTVYTRNTEPTSYTVTFQDNRGTQLAKITMKPHIGQVSHVGLIRKYKVVVDQAAPTMYVDAGNEGSIGNYSLKITVDFNAKQGAYVLLILSKVVAVPAPNVKTSCTYLAPTHPFYPFAAIDLYTANQTPLAPFDMLIAAVNQPPNQNEYPNLYEEANNETAIGIHSNINDEAYFTNIKTGYYRAIKIVKGVNDFKSIVGALMLAVSNVYNVSGHLGSSLFVAVKTSNGFRPPYPEDSPEFSLVRDYVARGYTFGMISLYNLTRNTKDNKSDVLRLLFQVDLESYPTSKYPEVSHFIVVIPYAFVINYNSDKNQEDPYLIDPYITEIGNRVDDLNPNSGLNGVKLVKIDVFSTTTFEVDFHLGYPRNVTPGSSSISVLAVGVVLGPIAIVEDPTEATQALSGSGVYSVDGVYAPGLILLNVAKLNEQDEVVVTVRDIITGSSKTQTIGLASSVPANYLFEIEWFKKLSGFDYWSFEYHPLEIIVSNADCTEQPAGGGG